MRDYLENCMQKQASASYEGYVEWAKKATDANEKLSLSGKALSGLKSLLKGIGSMALSTGIGMAINAVISLISTGLDKAIVTTEEARENLHSLGQECENIAAEISSYNDELKTTQDRINELQSKGTLSLTEQEEYDQLVKTNNELQRKLDLLAQEEKQTRKEKNKAFVDTMEKDANDASDMGKFYYMKDLNDENADKDKQFVYSDKWYKSWIIASTGGFSVALATDSQLLDEYEKGVKLETEYDKYISDQ